MVVCPKKKVLIHKSFNSDFLFPENSLFLSFAYLCALFCLSALFEAHKIILEL
ncbi:hypothetical protein HMPREF1981_02373 [Bacteroides pyogenes F0041]|uniref:Uncharacterized protein n=1 Tax=Bacteroides pyogenes F0041 TaxID=1321819 RepID=U2DXF4_9BACE|nr:hypothetical protein HMPREF1981_02373 [Bacteroides pyogenes F0041]MBB3895741.1 hypothetical protein [Bacteroides pyogenes]GAE22239.1 hypothetical protein JCM10003_1814 [Bacteroides pyogenes JCM 10003]SUV31390.1 Uncharacterised protein [Bacteroides pyogenes]